MEKSSAEEIEKTLNAMPNEAFFFDVVMEDNISDFYSSLYAKAVCPRVSNLTMHLKIPAIEPYFDTIDEIVEFIIKISDDYWREKEEIDFIHFAEVGDLPC